MNYLKMIGLFRIATGTDLSTARDAIDKAMKGVIFNPQEKEAGLDIRDQVFTRAIRDWFKD